MSEVVKASFQFNGFLIKESHFALKNSGEYDFELSFSPSGIVLPGSSQFQLQLAFTAEDQNEGASISVTALGFFHYEGIEDMANTPFFTENAPAILYPYVRAYITTLTAQSGIPPIILPTLNLRNMSDLLRQNITISNAPDTAGQ